MTLSVRELALEQKLGIAHQITDVDALIAQGSGSGNSGNSSTVDDPSLAEIRQLTLTQAQARATEIQLELDDARAQMNDLILEIDAVTVEDGKSREQSERLLRQMTESQSMQRGVLDENLRLHDQIAELHRKQGEEEMRIDHLQVQMKTQDAVISQLRSAENAARSEIQALRKTHSDEHSQRILNEQLVVEAEQKLKLAEHSAELAKKRNAELQTRCDELSGQVVSDFSSMRRKNVLVFIKSDQSLRYYPLDMILSILPKNVLKILSILYSIILTFSPYHRNLDLTS